MRLSVSDTPAYYNEHAFARSLVLLLMTISTFVAALSLSASLVAIPSIARDLQADAVYTSWIPSAFLLSNLIALLPGGKLADLYGRKRLFLVGSILLLAGSLAAGLSPTIEILLCSRAVQGAGAAFLFGASTAIVSSVYLGHGRGTALGWYISGIYTGLTIGPFLGGLINDHLGWQAVFLLPIPLTFFTLLLGWWKIRGEWRADDRSPLDYKGSLFLGAGLSLFFISIGKLPHWNGWLLLSTGFALLYAFVQHSNHSNNPLIRLKLLWENRTFSRLLGAAVMMYASNFGLMFLLSLYFQYNRGLSATEAGQILLIQAAVQALLAPLSGKLSDRYEPAILTVSGCLTMALGVGLLLLLDGQSPLYMYGLALALFGVSFGLFSTPNTSVAMASVSEQRLGIASALLSMGRLLGQLFGTALVTLLMAWFIGQQAITPALYDGLLHTLLACTAASLLFALCATKLSAFKASSKR